MVLGLILGEDAEGADSLQAVLLLMDDPWNGHRLTGAVAQKLAAVKFGSIVHESVKAFLADRDLQPERYFMMRWQTQYGKPLTYDESRSWESYSRAGYDMLANFPESLAQQELQVVFSEIDLFDAETGHHLKPDIIARDRDGAYRVIHVKVGGEWTETRINYDEKLTRYAGLVAYHFRVSPPIRVGICNFVVDDQEIKWLYSWRLQEQIDGERAQRSDPLSKLFLKEGK